MCSYDILDVFRHMYDWLFG